jgi:hypothetical protein
MNMRIWLVFLLIFTASAVDASTCGMYTYQDMLLDGNGNGIGENSTKVGSVCPGSKVYAEVQIEAPSGYTYSASAQGATFAEAVAQFTPAQPGIGEFSVYNEFSAGSCSNPLFGDYSFSWPFPVGESFTWFHFVSGTTFDQMQPCPEPGHTISCTGEHIVYASKEDIPGLFVEVGRSWLRIFGRTLCSPFGKKVASQNTAPERPYCYDLP